MLENYKEVVEALESTNEAVLSHRLNDTFRVLTAISVIVLPLTLIASIWGMNTNVPGEGSHAGFFAVVGVMVVVLVGDDRALQAPRLALTAYHRTVACLLRGMTTRPRTNAASPWPRAALALAASPPRRWPPATTARTRA